MTEDAECQRSYIAVVLPNPMLQAVLATESNRLTWFSGMRTLEDLHKLTTATPTLHTVPHAFKNRRLTAETPQWERSNSLLLRLFAGVLFRSSQAARRMIELLVKSSSTQHHLDLDGIEM